MNDTKTPEMTPEESLRVIQSMIATSRRRFNQNGLYLILWGLLLIPGFVATYLVEKAILQFEVGYVWMGIVVVGFVGSFVIGYTQGRNRSKSWSHLDAIFGFTWLAFIIGWLMVQFLAPMQGGWGIVIFLLAANAVFISGITVQFKPLIFGGILMYVAVLSLFLMLPNLPAEHLLIQAGALLVGYVIPGIMLNRYVQQQKASA